MSVYSYPTAGDLYDELSLFIIKPNYYEFSNEGNTLVLQTIKSCTVVYKYDDIQFFTKKELLESVAWLNELIS